MQKLVSKGYTPIIPPDLIRHEIAAGCGYQPKGEARYYLMSKQCFVTLF
jgi:seryl-tRNA synthetase